MKRWDNDEAEYFDKKYLKYKTNGQQISHRGNFNLKKKKFWSKLSEISKKNLC